MISSTLRIVSGLQATLRGAATSWRPLGVGALAAALTLAALPALATVDAATPPARLAAAFAQLPIRFEPNVGQAPAPVRFIARGAGYGVALSERGIDLRLARTPAWAEKPVAGTATALAAAPARVQLRLLHASPRPQLQAEGVQASVSHYFVGSDASRWRSNVANFGAVRYVGVYPGIDWVIYGNAERLEYDLVVAPGADPSRIRIEVAGADRVALDANGDLLLMVDHAVLRQHRPVVYQTGADGQRQPVDARYRLHGRQVAFSLGVYDASRPLVIDPVLSYASYLGGSNTDYAGGIAVDAAGNAYVTGVTGSANFPTLNALRPSFAGGDSDAFIVKVSADGKHLLYATYLGGSGSDGANGVAVDAAGNAYVTGTTSSADFPLVNPAQATLPGSTSTFVTKLNASGGALLYSTYLGGSLYDFGQAIAVDAAGSAYVAGQAYSSDFPTLNALQPAYGGGNGDAFIAKLTPAGNALAYATYLGGTGQDLAFGIAVDAAGDAYVTGYTYSADFPLAKPLQGALGSTAYDAFVAKLNPAGNALLFSTYLGGTGSDFGYGIALDAAGNAYVVGKTQSTNFPVVHAIQATFRGGYSDGFVTKLAADGSQLIYSTYLGGNDAETAAAVAVDTAGSAYVAGITGSMDFPAVSPLQSRKGVLDGFVVKLDPAGNGFVWATPLGGSDSDGIAAVAVDGAGNAFVAGYTFSSDFPTVNAYQPALSGGQDGFVAKIGATVPAPQVTLSAAPATIHLGDSTTLSWAATNATACVASGPWTGTFPASGSAVVTPAAVGSLIYSLSCTGPGGNGTASATVTVQQPLPIVSISANPSTLTLGQSTTLSWMATNATTCFASGPWTGTLPASGSTVVTPAVAGAIVYSLSCTGPGGSGTSAVTVTLLQPPPSVSIAADPSRVTLGQSTLISWSTTNATSCAASGAWSGSRATSGAESVTPATTGAATYTLTCSGTGGSASASAKVTVNPAPAVTVTLTASPAQTFIRTGTTVTLSWTSTGATSCSASGDWSGSLPVSGSATVVPAARGLVNYRLTCNGPQGSASDGHFYWVY